MTKDGLPNKDCNGNTIKTHVDTFFSNKGASNINFNTKTASIKLNRKQRRALTKNKRKSNEKK